MEKFCLLTGDWTDPAFTQSSLILPTLPRVKELRVPLIGSASSLFWSSFEDNPPELVSLDHRHWWFSEKEFCRYVTRIATSTPAMVRVFDSPFGFERAGIDDRVFGKLLKDRTVFLVNALREHSPATIILAPLARFAAGAQGYTTFFSEFRNLFDACSLDLCCDLTDRSIAQLGSLWSQVRKISPKKAIVFASVPAYNETVLDRQTLDAVTWQPPELTFASNKLRQFVHMIEQTFHGQTTWLFTGTRRDLYGSGVRQEVEFFETCHFREDIPVMCWGPRAFNGLLFSDGKPKIEVLRTIQELAHA